VDVTSLLPPDDAAYGFDNISDVLGVSPSLEERYLSAASKIAAPTGLAHKICGTSARHSQAGVGLSACTASRGSFRQANWNSVPFIALLHARITANETLIRPVFSGVHEAAGKPHIQPQITLMCGFRSGSRRDAA